MQSKFQTIFENIVTRPRMGGFLRGDYVKIKRNALSHPSIQNAANQIKESLKELMKSDLKLRISNITPLRNNKSYDLGDGPTGFLATIHQELATGLSHNHITLPLDVLELASSEYDDPSKLPDSQRKTHNLNQDKTGKGWTADVEDDSYDKGKDWKNGKRK